MNYKEAGVDVEKGDEFVNRIQNFIHETYDSRVVSGVGGFAALYRIDEERLLAAGTDGVGTKVKLAQELNSHLSIGQDLVAMCVNDILCTGARPLFFLDYLASGKIDLRINSEIVRGIVDACKLAGCALIGGETAEMPGVYAEGVYDLAGFAVGEVDQENWIDGKQMESGQTLLGLRSSGFHSNGYSLVRKLMGPEEESLKRLALTPTRIYVKLVLALLKQQRKNVTGLAHITGGGIQNIPRMNEDFGYLLTTLPKDSDRPGFMNEIISRSKLNQDELYDTFNMGVGMVIAVRDPDQALQFLRAQGEDPLVLGQVTRDFKGIKIEV